MLSAEPEFRRRDQEIDEYLTYVEGLESQVGFSVTLMNTMKSSALLMMYNMIESTMTNLLQDVFDELQNSNISFINLNDKMKILVLTYTKRRSPAKLVDKMTASTLDLVVACFDRTDVFSGNLDCQKIRDTLKEIGINSRHKYQERALLSVKKERNDLAHGIKSFSDCGKSYTAKQLRDFHSKTTTVLQRVVTDFEGFINAKAYV